MKEEPAGAEKDADGDLDEEFAEEDEDNEDSLDDFYRDDD